MRHLFEKFFTTLVLGVIGLIFILFGAGFMRGYLNTQQETKLAEQIPLVMASQLMDLSSDTPVALEGRISERNTSHNGVVVYTIFQYRGYECDEEDSNDCEEVWLQTERVTPAIWLDLPDGRVRVGNNDYWAYHEPRIWRSTGDDLVAFDTLEYRGFPMGSPVYAIGKVNTKDGVTVNIDFLYGGNREDYLLSQAADATLFLWMGVIFGGIGLALIIGTIVVAVKTR